MRFTIRMSVVLPQPEVPRNTVVVCGAIVKEKSSTAFVSGGYIFDTWLKVDHDIPLRDDAALVRRCQFVASPEKTTIHGNLFLFCPKLSQLTNVYVSFNINISNAADQN